MKQTPLLRVHQKTGAELGEVDGWLAPLRYRTSPGRESACLADWSWITKIDVWGDARTPAPDGVRLLRLGRLHGLVLCEPGFRGAAEAWIAQEHLSSTGITGGYACFLLTGSHAREILAKLASADLRESSMPDGRAIQCPVAHAPGILTRNDLRGLLSYWILTPRDYAESVWESLIHAGEEFRLTPIGVEDVRKL